MTTKKIVVGIDGSPCGARALAWAAGEARRKGVDLVIAHATDTVTPAAASSAAVVTVLMEDTDYGRELLDEAVALVASTHPTVHVTTVLRVAHPAELLVGLGTAEVMLVVGTHGTPRHFDALVASLSQRVAAHAQCTVVVVPPERAAMSDSRRVVVGIDGPYSGHQMLRFGFQEAVERHASLLAVCAYGTFGRAGHDPILGPLTEVRRHEAQELNDALAHLQAEFPTVRAEARIVDEPVDGALFRASLDAELLIVGCRHDDGHWHSRLGPVTSRALRSSSCPIAVIGTAPAAALATT
jgi:nucleotide-binding universal stress UspA family protein